MLVPICGLYAIAFATVVAMILEGLAPLWSRTWNRQMASGPSARHDRNGL